MSTTDRFAIITRAKRIAAAAEKQRVTVAEFAHSCAVDNCESLNDHRAMIALAKHIESGDLSGDLENADMGEMLTFLWGFFAACEVMA